MSRDLRDMVLLGGAVIAFFLAAAFVVWLVYFRSAVSATEIGYPGVGMNTLSFAKDDAAGSKKREEVAKKIAELLEEAGEVDTEDTTLAKDAYRNVQVLGHLSDTNFTRLMTLITAWVSPEGSGDGQGCAYCHANKDGEIVNFENDENYAKIVSRRMLQMTMEINSKWSSHVGKTGVNCYTCHRGMNVPKFIWFNDPASVASKERKRFIGELYGQNRAVAANGYTTLNVDPYTAYMVNLEDLRVQKDKAIAPGKNKSLQDTELTYATMIHWSTSLGVNCTHCHNSRAFGNWRESPPTRATAWYGRRMVAALNTEYLIPLKIVYPAKRLGKLGDAPKLNCATCHQGVNKPLGGLEMLKGSPSLAKPGPKDSQDAAFWPTTGGEAPKGWPETGRFKVEEETDG